MRGTPWLGWHILRLNTTLRAAARPGQGDQMRTIAKTLLLATVMTGAACGRGDKSQAADSALNADMSLAGQANSAPALDSISAAEQGTRTQSVATRPRTASASPTRRTSTAPRTTSTTSTSSSTSSGTAPAPAPTTTVQKHTVRDAAIGATAGAIIGATASKDKVKGGLIGAAAGGIIGGVIGNNVDKTTTTTSP